MTEAFAVGSFWFVAALIFAWVVLTVSILNDNGFIATIALLLSLAFLQFVAGVDLFRFTLSHPLAACGVAVGYFISGTSWAVFKWWLYLRDYIADTKKEVAAGLIKHPRRPEISDHFGDFIRWAMYWPVSAMLFLFGDLIERVFKEIYRSLSAWLQKMADDMWAKAGFGKNEK